MIDYSNILLSLGFMLLGVVILMPNIKDKLTGKVDKYGAIMKIIFGGIVLFLIGLIMFFRELF